MDGKFMAVMIVLIVFGSISFQAWMKQKADTAKSDEGDEEKQALKRQVADLEERVQVLERIATDKSSRLKEEIDAL
jgi:uncharacterized protein YlxW (UPF0749 family)